MFGLFNQKKTKSDDTTKKPITPLKSQQMSVVAEPPPEKKESEEKPEITVPPADEDGHTEETEEAKEEHFIQPDQPQEDGQSQEEPEEQPTDIPQQDQLSKDEEDKPSNDNSAEPEEHFDPLAPKFDQPKPEEMTHERIHFMDDFAIDITREASDNKLDAVLERDEEIEQLIHILLRSKKNYAMLIGGEGVGKASIVKGLAQRIISGKVPKELRSAYVIQVDCLGLSGLFDKKELDFNLSNLLEKVDQSHEKMILMIDDISKVPDEIQTILSTLKSYLAKSQTRLIVCATPIEWQHHFSEDAFYQQTFERFQIEELSDAASVKVINNIRGRFETFHNVTFDDDVIPRAVFLARRYVGEEFLPEKALDIIDDAATLVKVEQANGKRDTNRVSQKDVDRAVSDRTGIALTTLIQNESDLLLKLEEYIHQHYIDQQRAIQLAADVIRKGRSVLASPKRPVASLLFLGASGTGKTKLAKALATILFGTEKAIIQFDITQETYREKLIDAVYRKPYSVVFLKDVETANPKTLLTLSEILSEGKVEHKGNIISFNNTLIICTSKVKAPENVQTLPREDLLKNLYSNLEKVIKQELINEFDEVIYFEQPSQKALQDIAMLQIQSLSERLMKQNISIAVSDRVLTQLAKESFNPDFGAHLLDKVVASTIENPIATMLLRKTFVANDTINVDFDEQTGKVVFAKTMRNIAEMHLNFTDNKDTDANSDVKQTEHPESIQTEEKHKEEPQKESHETDLNKQVSKDSEEIKPADEDAEKTDHVDVSNEQPKQEEPNQHDNDPWELPPSDAQDAEQQRPDSSTDDAKILLKHTPSFETYHQQVKHAYSDLLSHIKK